MPARTPTPIRGASAPGARVASILALIALPALGVLAAGDPPALLAAKIVFEKPDGKEAFRLDPEGAAAELQSAGGEKLATYERHEDKLRLILERGAVAGTVEASAERDRYTLRAADGKTVERVLRREPDGDWELLDRDEKVLAELKLRDDGFKIVDAKGTEAGRVKVKGEEKSLRDATGAEVLETSGAIPALAAACFQSPALTLPQKGAFALAIILWPAASAPAKDAEKGAKPG